MQITTMVRMKVARSELTFSTPTFAKIAVRAANTADSTAQNCHDENALAFMAPTPLVCVPSLRAERSNPVPRRRSRLLRRFAPRNDEKLLRCLCRRHAAGPDHAPADAQRRQPALHRARESA